MLSILFLSVLGLSQAAITPTTTKTYPHTIVLDGTSDVHLFWEFDSTTITFELHVGTTGWIALGMSSGGGMNGADVAVGWVDTNGAQINDAYATGQFQPALDASQDLTLTSGAEYTSGANTITRLTWTRKLYTCDTSEDNDVEDGTVRMIYAFGTADPASYTALAYHGTTNRGSKSVRLLEPVTNSTLPAGALTTQFLNPSYTIPTAATTYYCRVFAFPVLATKHHVIQVNPIIQAGNEGLVHHILLYRCYGTAVNSSHVGTAAACYGGMMPLAVQASCFNVFASWAIGGGNFEFPAHVGYPVGGGHGPDYLVMETHYDNPTGISGRSDSSGLEIAYISAPLRQFDAGIMEIGDQVSYSQQIIPPHFPDYENRGWCKKDCLQPLMNNQPIYIFATLLHAHLLGRKIYAQVVRNGQGIADLGSDKYYDFNLQESRLLSSEVTVSPGDDLIVNCFYDSTNRSTLTYGSLGSTDEMCLTYVYYYPTLNVTKCESSVTVDEIITTFLGGQTYNSTGHILTPASFMGAQYAAVMSVMSWTSATTRASYQSFQLDPNTQREYVCVQNGIDLLSNVGGAGQLTAAQGSYSAYSAPVATCTGSTLVSSAALLLLAMFL